MTSSTGSAPGRLDLLGGVADYSGALVLEVPTTATTTVTATPAASLEIDDVSLAPATIDALAHGTDAEARAALADVPSWMLYLIGVAVVLVRAGVIEPPQARLQVDSDVPIAQGVSSSAALEVATARALGAHQVLAPLELARWCQAAENGIVGAPCGIMDQVAVVLGRAGAVLPILCRPASIDDPVDLPPGVEVVGWPSGVAHDVGADAYARARAAAFMGRRMAEAHAGQSWPWTSDLPLDAVRALPDTIAGAAFIERWGSTDDPLTTVHPGMDYPVKAAAAFAAEEHRRATEALDGLRAGDARGIGRLLAASHDGYRALGLGHPATDTIVAAALDRPGVHGARSSGGGSGGTVVVLCERGALDDIEELIR